MPSVDETCPFIASTISPTPMPCTTGTSGNPAGRPLGSANKATATVREAITAALAGPTPEKLAAHLDTLTGKGYIDAYVKPAEFITPKLQRTALAADEANRRIEVMMNLSDSWQSFSNRLIAVRLGEQ